MCSNAESSRPIWMAYDVQPDGSLAKGRVLFDATALVRQGRPGVPDGMRVDRRGNLFAAGPGGILVITPQGKHIGTIERASPPRIARSATTDRVSTSRRTISCCVSV